MYKEIYEFCKVRNTGGAHKNGNKPSLRVNFITNLLTQMGIVYEIDEFTHDRFGDNKFHNIIMRGTSNRMVVAHHDVVNIHIDNANDNSASVINAIMIKKLMPEINVVLLDGEEPPMMGIGSGYCAQQIKDGMFGDIEWVLNLELTGSGGENFFVGNYPGKLSDRITNMFNCPIYNTPFNDAVRFRELDIDSVVINPLPITEKITSVKNENGYLNESLLWNCHSSRDTLDTINIDDMKDFVEKVVIPILSN